MNTGNIEDAAVSEIDADTGEILLKHDLTNIKDLANPATEQTLQPVSLDAIGNDQAKNFCKQYVDKLVELHLPKALANNPTIKAVVSMQQSMHTMSLMAMVTVVRNSMQLLSNLSVDDMYTPEGMLDPFKLQAILSTQQHVMDFVARFNAQIRQMPSIVQQMITEASFQQIVELREAEEQKEAAKNNTYRSNMSLSVMLKQAETEQVDDFEYVKPEPPKQTGADDINNEQGGLDDL